MRGERPGPFLKWAGGKRQLLPELLAAVAQAGPFNVYHEPFLGGGALFFALARGQRLSGGTRLSDVNPNLIDAYLGIRDEVETVIRALLQHEKRHSEAYFYEQRGRRPRKLAYKAARIVYLNRTCFNGLYRENSKGQFNTPFGRYANPRVCDQRNLRAVSAILRAADVAVRDFAEAAALAEPGDLVYFDPPYDPISATAHFTSYSKDGFGAESQVALAHTVERLAARGVRVIVSNSFTPLTRELYEPFQITKVTARRAVNSRPERRGRVAEALITTFPVLRSGIEQCRRRTKP